jgi:hypothetical protein
MPFLDRARLGEIFGVKPGTIKQYEIDSRPGQRFEKDPFPQRDGTVNRGPWWAADRLPEFEAWFARVRDRTGKGGRPPKRNQATTE